MATVRSEISLAAASGGFTVRLALALSGIVFLLMVSFGVIMRAAQAGWLPVEPELFYRLMTAHGIGMVGTAGLTGAMIMWLFASRHLRLTPWVPAVFLALFLVGVTFILEAILISGFAGAWTFLHPLPTVSGGVWQPTAAVVYLLGLLLVGVGFLLLHLEIGRGAIAAYGNLGRALALPLLWRGEQDRPPPPAVVAATAATVFNILGIVVGAAVVLAMLVNALLPSFAVDPLAAKNMIYFFGHVFINASIYMAVIAVYEVVPEYTGRPWKTTRVFAAAWAAIIILVLAVYPHHLLQDTVMPAWALVLGQILSYASGLPLLVVTVLSLLAYLYRAAVRWDLALALLVTGVGSWAVGVVPAIIDGMIGINRILHNTLWVPGHFHTYLLLGEMAMALGVMAWLVRRPDERLDGLPAAAFWTYLGAGSVFVLAFLLGGWASVPRRWAVHAAEWMWLGRLATVAALFVLLAAVVMVGRFLVRTALNSGR